MLFKKKVHQTRMSLSKRTLNNALKDRGPTPTLHFNLAHVLHGNLLFEARHVHILHYCLLRGSTLRLTQHRAEQDKCICSRIQCISGLISSFFPCFSRPRHFLSLNFIENASTVISIFINTLACFECFTLNS